MIWKIEFTPKARDQAPPLSKKAREALRLLVKDLQTNGPVPDLVGHIMENYGAKRKMTNDTVI